MNVTSPDLTVKEIKKVIINPVIRNEIICYITDLKNILSKEQIENYLETKDELLELALIIRMSNDENFIGYQFEKLKYLSLKKSVLFR